MSSPSTTKARLRPRSRKPRKGKCSDPAYREWILRQPSIVLPWETIVASTKQEHERFVRECESMRKGGFNPWTLRGHHHIAKDDRTMLPLYHCLHQETCLSVHAGGGRKRFAERFGIDWQAEIAKHNARYEAETGRKVGA